MTAADYDDVVRLWRATDGLGLSQADERDAIVAYLQRNPGMSFVAVVEGRIVGAVLGGHDGRRGYLHHLAVTPAWRRHEPIAARCQSAAFALSSQNPTPP